MPLNNKQKRERAKNGALMGYVEQLTYGSPAKTLTKEEIAKLYPGAKINLKPLTEEERQERARLNVKAANKKRFKKPALQE